LQALEIFVQGPIDSDDGQEEEKEPEESPHGHALPPPTMKR
jgi:hypothetical protein